MSFESQGQAYTFDWAFGSDATQSSIYDKVGKEAVQDVLSGYNGTIFAYGQTGSGKTHTMFGSDIYDDQCKGIIPRAAFDIFNAWDVNPDTKEIDVRCSMLEIYKENLRDLLTDDPMELKIKESPQRGVYVEGLAEYSIGCEDELMYWIDVGESRRVWAETRHNAVSSRSHSIFMLEVRQTFTNDSECQGTLNLVDLAGSEKVGKSGMQGQIFEEGTKINLSLSALGNVIHALTSSMEHIPYRDSKLTRLLQESLGGNYKTALVVTCSPHSSQLQDTMSAMKFAQRAKRIQNRVQINMKRSPDQLLKVIEELKEELRSRDLQIKQLIGHGASFIDEALRRPGGRLDLSVNQQFLAHIPEENLRENVRHKSANKVTYMSLHMLRCRSENKIRSEEQWVLEDVSDEGSANKANAGEAITNRFIDGSEADKQRAEEEDKTAGLARENERLKKRVSELTSRVEGLTKENGSLEYKLKQSEIACMEERKRVLILQDSLNKTELSVQESKHEQSNAALKDGSENVQLKIYANQVKALISALEDAETECFKLMKEKKENLRKETLEVCSLTVADYIAQDRQFEPHATAKWDKGLRTAGLAMAAESFILPAEVLFWFSHIAIDAQEQDGKRDSGGEEADDCEQICGGTWRSRGGLRQSRDHHLSSEEPAG